MKGYEARIKTEKDNMKEKMKEGERKHHARCKLSQRSVWTLSPKFMTQGKKKKIKSSFRRKYSRIHAENLETAMKNR